MGDREWWQRVVMMAFEQSELSPRELATRSTDTNSYYVSGSSVYRLLKAHDLIGSPAFIVIKAADEFKDKTTAPNQLWQTDFTCCVKVVRNANKTRTGANRQEGRTQTQGKGESIREPDQFAERAAGDQARRTGKTTRRGRCHHTRPFHSICGHAKLDCINRFMECRTLARSGRDAEKPDRGVAARL